MIETIPIIAFVLIGWLANAAAFTLFKHVPEKETTDSDLLFALLNFVGRPIALIPFGLVVLYVFAGMLVVMVLVLAIVISCLAILVRYEVDGLVGLTKFVRRRLA